MKVIGLGHKARQGKDTLARLMVVEAGKRGLYAKQYSFAAAVYSLARRLGMKGKDPRVLQALGTDVMRRIDENIWLKELANVIHTDEPAIAIITDVRFPNEYDYIRTHERSILVKVTRIDGSGSFYVAQDRDPNHPSETALNGYDWPYTIFNTDFESLHDASRKLIDLVVPE